jgi:endonuclease YncB( thermonuclease family)
MRGGYHPAMSRFLVAIVAGWCSVQAQVPVAEAWRVDPAPLTADAPSWVEAAAADSGLLIGECDLATGRLPVIDGDTIRLDGERTSVRLTGLDAEETFKDAGHRALARRNFQEYVRTITAGANPARPPKYGTPMGEAARVFLDELLRGVKRVRLEADIAGETRDSYGRILAHVLVRRDDRWLSVNVEMVRQGLSPYFVKYGRSRRFHAAFTRAAAEATEARRGIHADPPAIPCYPDYAARFAWWTERDLALEAALALKAQDPEVCILGRDADFQALKARAGETAAVVGVPGNLLQRGRLGIQVFPHREREDFAVVGPYEEVLKLGFAAEEGNLLLLRGTLSLHQGRPQFEVGTVRVDRLRAR